MYQRCHVFDPHVLTLTYQNRFPPTQSKLVRPGPGRYHGFGRTWVPLLSQRLFSYNSQGPLLCSTHEGIDQLENTLIDYAEAQLKDWGLCVK